MALSSDHICGAFYIDRPVCLYMMTTFVVYIEYYHLNKYGEFYHFKVAIGLELLPLPPIPGKSLNSLLV